MSLGDVLPALQQGAIDGAVASTAIFTAFHYQDAAKYATETGQPAIFAIVEISKKWFDTLPADLQQIIEKTAARETVTVNPQATEITQNSRKVWTDTGGELISLPPDEQAAYLKLLESVGTPPTRSCRLRRSGQNSLPRRKPIFACLFSGRGSPSQNGFPRWFSENSCILTARHG